ncbi:hypothetical protein CH302_01065 [Rhodococcus sp. 15-2388-1-1a]|uniref:hypothetical protein n=1 Tax=Nocardiaceae TaxID=85025 RepID=UPI000567E81D|nr:MULTISPECIES: hypothetical protein [Rhodococcus]OZF05244.1 hypothetical protein CH302_01065 [Rhodococcus sp. 15-2388-1-1a]
MPAVELDLDDIRPFVQNLDEAKAELMIADVIAAASAPKVAPCIVDEEFLYPAQAKAILRSAVLRWNDSGTGAVTQMSAGPFQGTIDNRTERKRLLWPSEIADLRELCGLTKTGRAFTIDTTPPRPPLLEAP